MVTNLCLTLHRCGTTVSTKRRIYTTHKKNKGGSNNSDYQNFKIIF